MEYIAPKILEKLANFEVCIKVRLLEILKTFSLLLAVVRE